MRLEILSNEILTTIFLVQKERRKLVFGQQTILYFHLVVGITAGILATPFCKKNKSDNVD